MMLISDLFFVGIILKLWIPVVVTDELNYNENKSRSEQEQREALLDFNPRILRRLLYPGSESNQNEVTFVKTQRPFHKARNHSPKIHRPTNIFGHYQLHQEVAPVTTLSRERSTFRPSPSDPLGLDNDNASADLQMVYHLQPKNIYDQNTRRDINEDQQLVHQGDDDNIQQVTTENNPRIRLTSIRHQIVPISEEREAQRENLILHLYQSYLKNLATNGPSRSSPNVEVNLRSNPKLTVKQDETKEEEIDENLLVLSPPSLTRQDATFYATLRPPPHEKSFSQIVLPEQDQFSERPLNFQQNSNQSPRPENSRPQLLSQPAIEPILFDPEANKFEDEHSSSHISNPGLKSAINDLQGHEPLHRINNQQHNFPHPVYSQDAQNVEGNREDTDTTGDIQRQQQPTFSNIKQATVPNQREFAPSSNFQTAHDVPGRKSLASILRQSFSRFPSKVTGTKNAQNFEIKEQGQRPQLARVASTGLFQTFPLQFRVLQQDESLPELIPVPLQKNKLVENFRPVEPLDPADLFNERTLLKKPIPIGKSLYVKGKSLGKLGGLYASMQIFPEYHSYGQPMKTYSPLSTRNAKSVETNGPVRKLKKEDSIRKRLQSTAANLSRLGSTSKPRTTSQLTRNSPTLHAGVETPHFYAPPEALISPAPFPAVTSTTVENLSTLPPFRMSLRRPSVLRNLVTRRQPTLAVLDATLATVASQQKDTESPAFQLEQVNDLPTPVVNQVSTNHSRSFKNKLMKKVRMRITHSEEATTSVVQPITQKLKATTFPLKFSSRYVTSEAQIPPTILPTAEVNQGLKPKRGRPFSSTPRRLVTKFDVTTPVPSFTDLPPSALLSSRNVLRHKSVRKVTPGSISERLRALKKADFTAPRDDIPLDLKREIPGIRVDTETDSSRMPPRDKGHETEFTSEEMSEILGITMPTRHDFSPNPDETETLQEAGVTYGNELENPAKLKTRHVSDDHLIGTTNPQGFLSIPILTPRTSTLKVLRIDRKKDAI